MRRLVDKELLVDLRQELQFAKVVPILSLLTRRRSGEGCGGGGMGPAQTKKQFYTSFKLLAPSFRFQPHLEATESLIVDHRGRIRSAPPYDTCACERRTIGG